MENKSYNISIICPSYNEEKSIEKAILTNIETFTNLNIVFEIIIVDDGSNDNTLKIANFLASKYSFIKVFFHNVNLGIGAAFRTAVNNAIYEYVILIPIDNPLKREDVEAYLPRMSVCDIVVGLRSERLGYNRFSKFASFFYNRILVPLLFNIGISDVNWIQVYRRELFSENIIHFESDRMFFLVEILIMAKRNKLIMAEVPAKMRKRLYGKGTAAKFSTMIQTWNDMIKFFIKLNKEGRIP